MEPNQDMCFCVDCHSSRGDKPTYPRGQPAKEYGLPVGWCRFAIKYVVDIHSEIKQFTLSPISTLGNKHCSFSCPKEFCTGCLVGNRYCPGKIK